MATNISENARETIKKFWTVRNGRNVKTERITRIFPHIHRTTILERTNATGNALASGIGRRAIADDDEEIIVEFMVIFKSFDEIKYQSV